MLRKFYSVKLIFQNSKQNKSRSGLNFLGAVAELMKHKDLALYGEIRDKEKLVATLEDGEFKYQNN